ncbi:MAG: DoxX family protein [Sphingobacterium sp.]
MNTLIVIVTTFIISIGITKLFRKRADFMLSGKIAMSAMLIFTAIGHFAFTQGMSMMLPDFIPYKIEIIYITGIIEVAAAIGLLIPRHRVLTAWLLIIFFVLILPANIYAAIHEIDFQNMDIEAKGVSYLWFRIPLQLFFIAWTFFFCIKKVEYDKIHNHKK